MDSKEDAEPAILKISNLKKRYQTPEGDTHTVIDIPEFSLPKDQVALRGESGSGKTTFLNLVAGILKADEGEIHIGGTNITTMSEGQRDIWRALNIGYIFQTFNLLQGYSALENVLLAMSFSGQVDKTLAEQLLVRVGLKDRLHYRPRQMSVGQQQRVAVARAMANNPTLVLADEPTGNLDPRRAQEALEMIRELCSEKDAALLLVSHDQNILDAFSSQLSLSEINQAAVKAAS